MNISIAVDANTYERVHAIAIFQFIPHETIDEWLMPAGKPRTDRDLATEVLLDVLTVSRGRLGDLWEPLEVSDILATDRGAALVVSTFLAALSRAARLADSPSASAGHPVQPLYAI